MWLRFLLKTSKCDGVNGDVELRNHGIKFCVGLDKSPAEMMKLITSSETMNPCSVSVVYKWHERFRNGRKSMEDGFEGWSALRCEHGYEGHHFLTRLAKTLSKHDV